MAFYIKFLHSKCFTTHKVNQPSTQSTAMTNGLALGLGTAGGVVAFLVAAWHGLTWWEVDVKCEKPKYTVIQKVGEKKDWLGRVRPVAEVRRYAPVLVAEVTLKGVEMREALSNGFRQIAGFIFGGNSLKGTGEAAKVAMTSPVTLEASKTSADAKLESAKIAMTSPVTAEAVSPDEYTISFIMPSKYTRATLPTPNNDNVKIREVPARTLAALAWRGSSPSQQSMEAKGAELRSALQTAGMRPQGPLHLWQYHPPFAPSWMRRNEVLLEVSNESSAQ